MKTGLEASIHKEESGFGGKNRGNRLKMIEQRVSLAVKMTGLSPENCRKSINSDNARVQ